MIEATVVKIGSNDLFGDFDYFSEGASFLIFCNLSLTTTANPCHSSSGY